MKPVMLTKSFILELFSAAAMQRWNDKIRPVELKELDKQAHKMTIAYFLGKFEESREGGSTGWRSSREALRIPGEARHNGPEAADIQQDKGGQETLRGTDEMGI
jgi:hypothetical protein